MKKLVLILLAVGGIMLTTAPESRAGVSIGIGVGFPGYYYPPYPAYAYGYYPYYPTYRPYLGVGYYRPYYWRHGRRYYRHCYR